MLPAFPPSRLPAFPPLTLAAAFFFTVSIFVQAAELGLLHRSTFETSQGFKPGNLDGQNGWKVVSGTAEVSVEAAHADSQGLIIHPSTPVGSVSLSVALPEGESANVVYTDVWVRPGADDLSGKGFSEAQGAYTGFFRVAAGGELYVFNGDGQGGGQWLPTQVKLPVENSGQARDWIRLSMRQDYRAKVWDLYINGTIFRANMGFWKDAEASQTNARFVFSGTTSHALLLDDFSVSTDSLLFPDADHDGLPDEWEKAHALDAAVSGRDDDADADGLTNVEELVLGTKPLVADSDGDGSLDGAEVLAGRNPTLKERHWKNLNFFAPEMPDAEFVRHHVVLAVPFLITGTAQPEECNELLAVLDAYIGQGQPDKVEGFEDYLRKNRKSPFATWVRAHAAITAFERSRYSKALPMLEDLWKTLPKGDPLLPAGVLRSLVGTNLATAYHLYGRTDEMGTVLENMDRVGLPGGVAERAHMLKADQWAQKHRPEQSNRCGYASLTALAQHLDPAIATGLLSQQVAEESPGKAARTLAQLADLATAAKLPVRLAQRAGKAAWVYPSLIHWKPGHFSVLLSREADGRYLIDDPGANTRRLVSAEALDEETSGACLVSSADLPAGWGSLERRVAEAAIGRTGVTQSPDDDCNRGCTSCEGVAEANFNTFRASLVVRDTPLVDSAPRGAGNSVTATWGQHSSSIIHTLSYTNLGSGTNWTLGYTGYVDEGSGNRVVFDETGNRTTHLYNGSSTFDRQLLTQQTLEKVYAGAFSGFRLKFEDGSYEEYFQAGKEPLPLEEKRYFLTKIVDAQGLVTCTIVYDSLQRLSSISGVPGAATLTFGYYGTTDYKIYSISDNRNGTGRSCFFTYDGSNRLQTIYDVMGITSTFGYYGSFISSLTTPYGTSNFFTTTWSSGANWGRYLNLTDPRGWTQRVLYSNALPGAKFAGDTTLAYEIPDPAIAFVKTNDLVYGASWHWDKQMFHSFPPVEPSQGSFTNFDKATHTSWMKTMNGNSIGVPASVRRPDTSMTNTGGHRTFFVYKDQTAPGVLADTNLLQTSVRKVWAWNPAIGADDEIVND